MRDGSEGGYILTWLVLLLAGAATLLPLCHTFFQCGCAWPWAGGMAHCNIHIPGAAACPWCAAGWRGFLPALAVILAGALSGIMLAQWLHPKQWLVEVLFGALGWLVGAAAAAAIYAWIFQYPHFVFFTK